MTVAAARKKILLMVINEIARITGEGFLEFAIRQPSWATVK